jgi:hypothetical protein
MNEVTVAVHLKDKQSHHTQAYAFEGNVMGCITVRGVNIYCWNAESALELAKAAIELASAILNHPANVKAEVAA